MSAKQFFNIMNIDKVDFDKLMKQLPKQQAWNPFSVQAQYIMAILQSYDLLKQYEINSALRLAHFFGQGLVETGFLSAKSENLNYSFDALKKMWSHKFSGEDEMRAYARKPEKIANRIYANRMGNGPEESGDGWRYRGRGFFQLTGKDNYRRYGEMAGLDLVGDPDMLERDLKLGIRVAAAFMQKTGLLAHADRNDIAAVSRGVNRGNPNASKPAYHEAERIEWTARALALVKNPDQLVAPDQGGQTAPPAPPAPTPPDDGVLRVGKTGPAVEELQKLLNTLGYTVDETLGVFGPKTRGQVLIFQDQHGLPKTGDVDAATLAALKAAVDDRAAPAPAPTPSQPGAPPAPGEIDKPMPKAPAEPAPEKPLAQSRTIWGAIVAGFAGVMQFLQQQLAAIPDIATPWGTLDGGIVLVVVIVLAVAWIIYARIDDRAKKGR